MAVKTLMKWLASVGMILAAAVVLASAGGARAVSAAGLGEVAAGTAKWNAIALAMDNTSAISNAQALASAISGTEQILKWNAGIQNFEYYVVSSGAGTNFSMVVGEPYLLLMNNTAPSTFSLVGSVPPATGSSGAVEFSIIGGTSCKWNHISLPLDHGSISNAQELASDIGNVEQVLRWNATIQNFEYYVVSSGAGTNFQTGVGQPFWICSSQSKIWP